MAKKSIWFNITKIEYDLMELGTDLKEKKKLGVGMRMGMGMVLGFGRTALSKFTKDLWH